MAPRPLHRALACLLLLGVSGLTSTHDTSRLDGDTERDEALPQRALSAVAMAGSVVEANDPSSRAVKEDNALLKRQHSTHAVERSYGMGYGGYGYGHKLDLYSSLAIFSFAIFLGYILYNYIRAQQAAAAAKPARSLLHSATDDVWSLVNSLDLEGGTRLAARVLSSLERWDDVLDTLPRDPSLVDVVGLIARRLF